MRKKLLILGMILLVIVIAGYSILKISNSRSFQFFGGIVNKVETEEKVVALTFDDGPAEKTDEILQILDDKGIKATFFLTGKEIEENQREAKKIAEAGHELANHSYSHTRMVFKSPSFIKTEIERTDQLIREAGYEGSIPFRPPYGKKFVLLPYYLKSKDRETILWNLEPDSLPELANNPEKMVKYVNEHIEPGSIILMHVMYESREPSLEAVERIIHTLKEKGYTFTTVTELLKYK